MSAGKRVQEARLKAGLTQQALSERTGISINSIQSWEKGHRNPRPEAAQAIADACGVTLAYIVLGEQTPAVTPRPDSRPPRDDPPEDETALQAENRRLREENDLLWQEVERLRDNTAVAPRRKKP